MNRNIQDIKYTWYVSAKPANFFQKI